MSNPFIWSGNYAKSLKSSLNINDQVYMINGSVDPTVVAQNAPAGSIYQRTNGSVYVKQDAGSTTNWTALATGGGGSVTSQRVIDSSAWTTGTSLPTGLARSNLIIIGTKAYLIGGNVSGSLFGNPIATAKTYVADLTVDPTSFTDNTTDLPAGRFAGNLFRVGNTLIYAGGISSGGGSETAIFTSTITGSSISVWTNTGLTLPTGKGAAVYGIVGSKLYIWGGFRSSTTVSANIASPTVWSTEAGATSIPIEYGNLAIANGHIYILGGAGNSSDASVNTIYSASVSNPISFTSGAGTVPNGADNMILWIAQDKIYLAGGEGQAGSGAVGNTLVYSASANNPLSWVTTSYTLAVATQGAPVMAYNGKLYIIGGDANASLSGAKQTSTQVTTQFIDVKLPSYSGLTGFGGTAFDLGGQQYIMSTFNMLGYAPWTYDAFKPY